MSETNLEKPGNSIRLANPMQDYYAAFILGNAQFCDRVVTQDSHKGQNVVICGAGPSLKDYASKYCTGDTYVIGCNSAGPWLLKNGYRCDAFLSVDQTSELIGEWVTAPDVDYFLASTVHPNLTSYLLSKNRRITWFHNFVSIKRPPVAYSVCGQCDNIGSHEIEECVECKSTELDKGILSYEDWMYMALYPGTVRAGSGLNTATRAIDVAMHMGFEKIRVLGADCLVKVTGPCPTGDPIGTPGFNRWLKDAAFNASGPTPEYMNWLKKNTVMHANGGSALANNQSPLMMTATIDPYTPNERIRRGKGIPFMTKTDLLVTAVFQAEMERAHKGRLEFVGDGLTTLLRKKNRAFLQRLVVYLSDEGEHPVEYVRGAA